MANLDREKLFERFKHLSLHIISPEDTSCEFLRSVFNKLIKKFVN